MNKYRVVKRKGRYIVQESSACVERGEASTWMDIRIFICKQDAIFYAEELSDPEEVVWESIPQEKNNVPFDHFYIKLPPEIRRLPNTVTNHPLYPPYTLT